MRQVNTDRRALRRATALALFGFIASGCALARAQPTVPETSSGGDVQPPPPSGRAASGESYGILRAVSADGTQIVGRVRGRGPPLVLVHGGLGDGESTWNEVVPLLADSFTCYLPSTRGRGSSATPAEPDYALEQLTEDVVAFVEAIGEPVYLAGYSLGGVLALAAAARSVSVAAVAVYEPPVFEVHEGDEHLGRLLASRMREAAEAGHWAMAARLAIEGVAREEELTALSEAEAFQAWAPNVPVALQEMAQAADPEAISPTSPVALSRIETPILYLFGSLTPIPWYRAGADHVATHAEDVRILELVGTGHFAPRLAPQPLAWALTTFFGER